MRCLHSISQRRRRGGCGDRGGRGKQRPGRSHQRPDPRERQQQYNRRKKRLATDAFAKAIEVTRKLRTPICISVVREQPQFWSVAVLKFNSLILTHDPITRKGVPHRRALPTDTYRMASLRAWRGWCIHIARHTHTAAVRYVRSLRGRELLCPARLFCGCSNLARQLPPLQACGCCVLHAAARKAATAGMGGPEERGWRTSDGGRGGHRTALS
jgi:hypothetical protein